MNVVKQWIIGRAEACDIRVDDEYASLHHARIIRDDLGRHWVEDLGSTNGTRVLHNGATVKVTARPLRLWRCGQPPTVRNAHPTGRPAPD